MQYDFIGHAPNYTGSLLTPVSDIPSWSSLRSSSNYDLVVPRTSRKIGDRAFSVAAPRAWNWLPTDLKLLRSTASFKSKLKSFLFMMLAPSESDCRRCTTSHLCYCYNMLRNTLPRRKLHFYQTMTCDFHPF